MTETLDWSISFDNTIYKLVLDQTPDPDTFKYFARATLQMDALGTPNFYLNGILLNYTLCQSVVPTSIEQVMDFIVSLGV